MQQVENLRVCCERVAYFDYKYLTNFDFRESEIMASFFAPSIQYVKEGLEIAWNNGNRKADVWLIQILNAQLSLTHCSSTENHSCWGFG
jgi:hypothetical protein